MRIEEIIATGGDERIQIRENGLNKYHIHPAHYQGIFNRGSCTVNLLNDETYPLMGETLKVVEEKGFAYVKQRQADEMKDLINLGERSEFEIFFSPSGTDLCYYPLLFARILKPDKPIYNMLTCPEELGSGSLSASSGNHAYGLNQFGEEVAKDKPIGPNLNITTRTFPARDTNGKIIDHRKAILNQTQNAYKDNSLICNLVIGSKSGIYDNFNIIPSAPREMLWVVDMCQFRAARSLVHELIELNAMIMITGSKFYQSPPFCGAMLVPNDIVSQLKEFPKECVAPFANIFSKYDIPECLPELRQHFRDYENLGLLLRWEAAIHEMKIMSNNFKTYTVLSGISRWNDFVVGKLADLPEYFELMPDQDLTNKTIVSITLKDKNGKMLNDEQLGEVYKDITLREHSGLRGYNRLVLGQPVKYTDRSFIRMALGAHDLRKLFATDFDLSNDERAIHIILESLKRLYW